MKKTLCIIFCLFITIGAIYAQDSQILRLDEVIIHIGSGYGMTHEMIVFEYLGGGKWAFPSYRESFFPYVRELAMELIKMQRSDPTRLIQFIGDQFNESTNTGWATAIRLLPDH